MIAEVAAGGGLLTGSRRRHGGAATISQNAVVCWGDSRLTNRRLVPIAALHKYASGRLKEV